MNKQFVIGFLFFVIPILFAGCNSSTQNTQVQDIVELKWQADGNAIYGFIQSYTATGTSTIPSTAYSIARFNSDGSLAQTYKTDPLSRSSDPATGSIDSYAPSIYLSTDGSTIVTQLEGDLYKFHTQSGALEKLATQFHLIVASPDLRYVVGSPSLSNQPIKTIEIYDMSALPIRLVTHFDVKGVAISSGIWLNSGTFGITINEIDSSGTHISIFDTTSTGTPITVIGGAETPFHNVVFNPNSNTLYVRDHAGKSTDYFVDKVNLTTSARSTILNFKVENFDISRDENVIVYSAYDTLHTIHLKSRNLVSSNELVIGDDIRLIVALSPLEDKLAYIRQRDQNFNEVRVLIFTKP